jgi:hypothetical protein
MVWRDMVGRDSKTIPGNGKTSPGVAPGTRRWAVARRNDGGGPVADLPPTRTRVDSWRELRSADTMVRVSPVVVIDSDEVASWPERTDAHVGRLREGYALAACLRCKLSFTWRHAGR